MRDTPTSTLPLTINQRATPNQNPKQQTDNVVVGTRDRMHDWFNAATMWLAKKGGPTWRVDHVFMWNLNSWDVQGIHMESTTKEGSYRDDAAYRILRSHNLRVRGLTGYDAPGSIAPY
jgi:hypothetical protein